MATVAVIPEIMRAQIENMGMAANTGIARSMVKIAEIRPPAILCSERNPFRNPFETFSRNVSCFLVT